MAIETMEKGDAYEYLDACLLAKNKTGNPRPMDEALAVKRKLASSWYVFGNLSG